MKWQDVQPISGVRRAAIGVVALLLFILALEMMKCGAGAVAPILRGHLTVDDAADSLGLGWLMVYLLLSGSPVAADCIDRVRTL